MSDELYYRGSSSYEIAVKNRLSALETQGAMTTHAIRDMSTEVSGTIRQSTYAILASQEALGRTFVHGFNALNNNIMIGFDRIGSKIDYMTEEICESLDKIHDILNSPLLTASRELYRRALTNYEKGYFEEALEDCKAAVEKNKTDFISWTLLGQIYLFGAGKFSNVIDLDKAEESFFNAAKYIDADIEHSIEARKLASEIYYYLGYTKLIKSNDLLVANKVAESNTKLIEAETSSKKAYELSKENLLALYEQAKELHFLGNDGEALRILKEVIRSDKNYALKASCDKNFESLWSKIDELISRLRDELVDLFKNEFLRLKDTLEKLSSVEMKEDDDDDDDTDNDEEIENLLKFEKALDEKVLDDDENYDDDEDDDDDEDYDDDEDDEDYDEDDDDELEKILKGDDYEDEEDEEDPLREIKYGIKLAPLLDKLKNVPDVEGMDYFSVKEIEETLLLQLKKGEKAIISRFDAENKEVAEFIRLIAEVIESTTFFRKGNFYETEKTKAIYLCATSEYDKDKAQYKIMAMGKTSFTESEMKSFIQDLGDTISLNVGPSGLNPFKLLSLSVKYNSYFYWPRLARAFFKKPYQEPLKAPFMPFVQKLKARADICYPNSQDDVLHKALVKMDKAIEQLPEGTAGCYVATSVYGSYDCPQVWTLRRFRDYKLAATWYGRSFIHAYYAISPTIVKYFGETAWFKSLWRTKLDRMVNKLKDLGFADTPYNDIEW